MSSEKNLRRRAPSTSRRGIPCPIPSPRRRTPPATPRKSRPSPKPIKTFHRCSSEPLIPAEKEIAGDDEFSRSFDSGGWLYRPQTCFDVFDYHPSELTVSPLSQPWGYEKEAKVVIKVTVEGSVGPISAMVKLGSSVEDTIKLVIQKYGDEGRSPRLDPHSPSSFDLHLSYFSLHCLDRSNTIGEIGSRNFYLRKSNKNAAFGAASSSLTSEIIQLSSPRPPQPNPHTSPIFPTFFSRKFSKFVRRIRKLFKLMGCLHCG